MSLVKFGRDRGPGVQQLRENFDRSLFGSWLPVRGATSRTGSVLVNNATAMRHSAVWACLALRAGLLSTFPIDVFRDTLMPDGTKMAIEMGVPPVLKAPGGEDWEYPDWVYASQVDLDRAGNTIGLITEVNAAGLPARIDLQDINSCSVRVLGENTNEGKPGSVIYTIDGKKYDRSQVWHERAYRVPGLPVGLAPVAYGAWAIGEYLSMQKFALDWFGGGGVPKAILKSKTLAKIDQKDSGIMRDRWRGGVNDGDVIPLSKDWEYEMIQAQQMGVEWLEGRRFGLSDIARFLQCPADLIDAAISAPGTLTYASMTQRNLQFLIMQMDPPITRRERAFSSRLLPKPRYAKLNTDKLLRMDPETRGRVMNSAIAGRRRTVTEARALDNLPPLTPDQEAEFIRLFGDPTTKPSSSTPPKISGGTLSQDELDKLERALQPVRATAQVGRPRMIGDGRDDPDAD